MADEERARAEGLTSTSALAEAVERTAVELVLQRLRAPSDGEARAAQAQAELWLGIVDRVLSRVDRWLALREAAARVQPPTPQEEKEPKPEPGAEEWTALLEYIAARPPVSEAASRLRALGVAAEHVPALLDELATEPSWAAWVESSRAWIEDVQAALASPAEEAACN